jgi:GNAT superfamily N-acetyltransferase
MTAAPRQPRSLATDAGAGQDSPVRIPIALRLDAAARLVGDPAGRNGEGARRMLAVADAQGIDLSLIWGTVDRDARGTPIAVRQACLLVPGTGRTAMLLASHPLGCGPEAEQRELLERTASIEAACAFASSSAWDRSRVNLAQALPDPQEYWAVDAFNAAGFQVVGDLSYMRRPAQPPRATPTLRWPPGVVVRNVEGVRPGEPDRERVIQALDRTYIGTLDCPDLCGLRSTSDVLDSHRSTGHFDPRYWWLILLRGEPHGCMFFSHTPELASAELVYLGLSPDLRRLGLGRSLMEMGLARLADLPIEQVTCAVDLRNTPALSLYERLGFERCGRRVAMVRPLSRA